MSEGHVCKCRECHPQDFPSGPRQGPNHFGVRFKDRTRAEMKALFYMNGERPTHVTEAMVGTDGWIRRYSGTVIHRCTCGGAGCEEIIYGRVTTDMECVGRGIEERMYYMEAHQNEFPCLEEDDEYRALGLARRLKRFQRCPACDRYCQSKDPPGEAATLFMCDCGWLDWVKESEWVNALNRDDVYVRMAMDTVLRERKLVRTCP